MDFGLCERCGWWHDLEDEEACMIFRGDEPETLTEDDFANPYAAEEE